MKRVAVLALSLLMAACGSGGGGKSGAGGAPQPAPGPKPAPILAWGDLSCQRRQSCEDLALNVDLISLHRFFSTNFAANIDRTQGDEYVIYQCGIRLGKAWRDAFRQDGFDEGLGNFYLHVLDPVRCSPRGGLNSLLQTYFENTREYKNEIQNLGGRGA